MQLYLNIFRQKPAIIKFDKPFTPNHNLFKSYATDTNTIQFHTKVFTILI